MFSCFPQTVMAYMYKKCTCVGVSNRAKQCSHYKVCQLVLPTMDEVTMKLKMKYDKKNHQRVHPGKMIYFNNSPNYCIANPEYNITGTVGRECTLNNTSHSHHCDNLCCGHGYDTYIVREACKCIIIWCCIVKCSVCHSIEYRCRDNLPEASSYL